MSKPPAFSVEPQGKAAGPVHRFAFDAMASVFEVIIAGQEQRYARQAAEAASDEVERLERELSRFNPSSDVSQIGGLKPGEYARVGVATMECLMAAARVHAETGGAFDVTVGALAACFRGPDGKVREPPADELAAARRVTGMHLLDIRPDEHTVAVRVRRGLWFRAPAGMEHRCSRGQRRDEQRHGHRGAARPGGLARGASVSRRRG